MAVDLVVEGGGSGEHCVSSCIITCAMYHEAPGYICSVYCNPRKTWSHNTDQRNEPWSAREATITLAGIIGHHNNC